MCARVHSVCVVCVHGGVCVHGVCVCAWCVCVCVCCVCVCVRVLCVYVCRDTLFEVLIRMCDFIHTVFW